MGCGVSLSISGHEVDLNLKRDTTSAHCYSASPRTPEQCKPRFPH
jgi:hypothetical protein